MRPAWPAAAMLALFAAGAPVRAVPAEGPPAAAVEEVHYHAGSLVRVNLVRRAFVLQVGSPARELEVKVDDAAVLRSDGRTFALRDLRPGSDARVACVERDRMHHARLARFTLSRR